MFFGNAVGAESASAAYSMKSCQIGAAIFPPVAPFPSGFLSSSPT